MSNDERKASTSSSEIFTGNLSIESQEIPFAHFANECSLKDILKVMIEEWNLQIPNIMVILVSDNSSLSGWIDFKEQQRFVKGLIKASNATSMWILTTGLNIGLPKLVGDNFQLDYKKRYAQFCYTDSVENEEIKKTPLIGVCRDELLTYSNKFKNLENNISLQNVGNKPEEHKFDLNVFHTNFLLLRDKTVRKSGINKFFLNLENAFRGASSDTYGKYVEVPQ